MMLKLKLKIVFVEKFIANKITLKYINKNEKIICFTFILIHRFSADFIPHIFRTIDEISVNIFLPFPCCCLARKQNSLQSVYFQSVIVQVNILRYHAMIAAAKWYEIEFRGDENPKFYHSQRIEDVRSAKGSFSLSPRSTPFAQFSFYARTILQGKFQLWAHKSSRHPLPTRHRHTNSPTSYSYTLISSSTRHHHERVYFSEVKVKKKRKQEKRKKLNSLILVLARILHAI